MISVGITGTLGAGKSTVGRLFEGWGAHRIDADELARRAVAPGSEALATIRERWGEAVIDREGGLDRAAMREIVFGNDAEREALEAIIHPAVGRLRDESLERAREMGAEIVISEVPLLFEKDLADEFDLVVTVDAPVETRRRRVRDERGLDAASFDAIDAVQWPPARKREAADLVIDNDGSRSDLEEAAREVWRTLRRRAESA